MIAITLLTTAVLAAALPAEAVPAEAVPMPDTISMPEVTVTAIKQSADLRTQATSAAVLRRAQLERNRVANVRQATTLTPNVLIPDYGSRMTSTVYVRGIGSRIDQPAVGLNIDNIPVLCKENYDVDMVDLSRFELLLGPQSTLYGRNTMGGLMNVYTLSPLNWQGTRLQADYGSHNTWRVAASHYAKPLHNLGIGATVQYQSTDGEWTNQHNHRKADWEHQVGARLKLEWMPTPTLLVANVLHFNSSRQGGYPYEYQPTGQVAYNDTCFYRRDAVLDGLTITKHFEHFTLSSISSYQFIDDNMTLDQDFTPEPYFTLTQRRREHGFTQDLVARHKGTSGYQCLTGLFGFYRHYNMDAPVTFKPTGINQLIIKHFNDMFPGAPLQWNDDHFVLGSHFSSATWGTALYHQSTLELGRWSLSAGVRLDYEHAGLRYHSFTSTGYSLTDGHGHTLASVPIEIDDTGHLQRDFLQLLPRFSVIYRMPGGSRIYASVAKGYKSGGFNTQMFSDVLQQRLMGFMGLTETYEASQVVSFKPEKAWNYELGGHFECWDGRVQSDLSLFYMHVRDRQLTVFPDGTTTGRMMANAGRMRSWGGEFTMAITPLDRTELRLSYGYTNAKFTDYNDGKADYKGNYAPYSPTSTLAAEASQGFTLGGNPEHVLTLGLDVKGVGPIYWNEANDMKQRFYALMGAQASLKWNRALLTLWGTNLTDTRYKTFYFVSIGHAFLQRGRGRALGVTLNYEF